jgi:hypothetical protein
MEFTGAVQLSSVQRLVMERMMYTNYLYGDFKAFKKVIEVKPMKAEILEFERIGHVENGGLTEDGM